MTQPGTITLVAASHSPIDALIDEANRSLQRSATQMDREGFVASEAQPRELPQAPMGT